jgi:hypothetical protein
MRDYRGRFAIVNREGQSMSFTLIRPAAGLALLAALAAGCGNTVAAQPAAPKPAASAHHHHSGPMHTAVTTPPAPPTTAPAHTANPIPQGNGGDQDADNNGGPSDGDGNI